MSVPVGIMQGRLLPPFEGRFQAFPAADWRREFARAAEAGLACIEWIYEMPHADVNPLGSDAGLAEIAALAAATGVAVRSICADAFMTDPLVGPDARPVPRALDRLSWLCGRAAALGATYVVLPFVDSSSLSPARADAAIRILRRAAPAAREANLELHVECDLAPDRFRAFLEAVDAPNVKANFDIGNSAALGYDPEREMAAIGPYLGSVHVKDRLRGGGTRPLGTGDADLPRALAAVRRAGFARWLILQAARGSDGDEAALAAANRRLVQDLWDSGE